MSGVALFPVPVEAAAQQRVEGDELQQSQSERWWGASSASAEDKPRAGAGPSSQFVPFQVPVQGSRSQCVVIPCVGGNLVTTIQSRAFEAATAPSATAPATLATLSPTGGSQAREGASPPPTAA